MGAQSKKATLLHTKRRLKYSTGRTCRSNQIENASATWVEFKEIFRAPVRTDESFEEFRALGKSSEATKIKDVGYFCHGQFTNDKRSNQNLKDEIDCLQYDLDYLNELGSGWAEKVQEALSGIEYLAYTTHSHCPSNPRLRLIVPVTCSMTKDEYEPIARKVAERVGIEAFDDCTFQPGRPMFKPSASRDGEFLFLDNTGNWVDPDEVLAEYTDWTDSTQWPKSSRERTAPPRQAGTRAQDPLKKDNFVGTVCRAYPIQEGMEHFIPGVYEEGENGRFTYHKSTTANGAIVYDDRFLYSHHASDPAGGQTLNLFDLVRHHKYIELDKDVSPDTPPNRLPSYQATVEFFESDERVKAQVLKELIGEVTEDDHDTDWMADLTISKGRISPTLVNVRIILENDPHLAGAYAFNEFTSETVVIRSTPWKQCTDSTNGDALTDYDDLQLRDYLACKYQLNISSTLAFDAVNLAAQRSPLHPPRAYLKNLVWDGTIRVNNVLHDYLGVEKSDYTQAVIRKTLCAAVARIFEPGIKFDHVLILEGDQGVGKSTFIQLLAGPWFGDGVTDFRAREAVEAMIGAWIIELPELQVFSKTDIEQTKAFISRPVDKTRLAYGRRPLKFPRQSIFIGTTNDSEYLRDDTGNRRFWPVKCHAERLDFDKLKSERDQIWAEAVVMYEAGEKLYLDSPELEAESQRQQKSRYSETGWESTIRKWLSRPIPPDHFDADSKHTNFWGTDKEQDNWVERDRTCSEEIWTECLNGHIKDLNQPIKRRIAAAMRQIDGWEGPKTIRMGTRYGRIKGYSKCT